MVAEPRPATRSPPRPSAGSAGGLGRWPPLGGLLALNLAAWAAFWITHAPDAGLRQVRAAAPWSALLGPDAPTLLVLGDYYIFGDIDEAPASTG